MSDAAGAVFATGGISSAQSLEAPLQAGSRWVQSLTSSYFFRNNTAPSLYPLCVVPHIFRGATQGSHTETQFLLQTPLVLRFQCICFYFNAPLSMHHIFAECHVPCTRQI